MQPDLVVLTLGAQTQMQVYALKPAFLPKSLVLQL